MHPIEDGVFFSCINLKSIEIPKSVIEIGCSAFAQAGLTNVTIPESVTKIGARAFDYNTNLTNVTIPESVTEIGEGTFQCCKNLININIPKNVTEIGDSAFSDCTNLKDIIIPDSVTKIGPSAFMNCSNLINIKLPNSITEISKFAFCGCHNLVNIDIPNSVTKIGLFAFCYCRELLNANIPNNIKEIGKSAYYRVKNLQIQGKKIEGDILTPQLFELIKNNPNVNLKYINNLYSIAVKKKNFIVGFDSIDDSIECFVALCYNLGMLENKSNTISVKKNGKIVNVPICELAYVFVKRLIDNNKICELLFRDNMVDLKIDKFNVDFAKYVMENWEEIKKDYNVLPKIYEKFSNEKDTDLQKNKSSYEFDLDY